MVEKDKILITDFLIIDISNMRYKPLHSILFFFKIGTWKPLPSINSVAVTQINFSYTTTMSLSGGATSSTNKHKAYCVFLRAKGMNISVYKGGLVEMRKGAKLIGDFLNKPVNDYCEK